MISDKIPGRWKKGSAVVMCQRCKHRMDDHTFGPGINVNPRVACNVCVTHNGGECCIRNATSAEISRKKPLPYKENAIVLEPGTTYCEVVRICHPSEPGEIEIVSQYVPHEEVPVGSYYRVMGTAIDVHSLQARLGAERQQIHHNVGG